MTSTNAAAQIRDRPDWTALVGADDLRPLESIRSADDVQEAQDHIGALLEPAAGHPHAVGLYWFNQFYSSVTRKVRERLADDRFGLKGDTFLDRLDVRFYARYDQALRAGLAGTPTPAWEPLLGPHTTRSGQPLRWALLGVHAHIIFDLPAAILNTLEDLQKATRSFPDPRSAEYRAYDSMNRAIYEVGLEALRENFGRGLAGLALHLVRRPVDLSMLTYIKAIRDAAWWRAQVLWQLHRDRNQQGVDATEAWYGREVEFYNLELEHLLDIRKMLFPGQATARTAA